MMTFTGLDHRSFVELNTSFQVLFDTHTLHGVDGMTRVMKKMGRKRVVTSSDCLALVLSWTRTRGSMFASQMLFAFSGSTASEHVRFGKRILTQVLRKDEDAQVQIPAAKKPAECNRAVESQHPALKNVWMTVDELKMW